MFESFKQVDNQDLTDFEFRQLVKKEAADKEIFNLIDKINVFLKEYRESNGGWSNVTDEDIFKLKSVIDCLINLKSELDPVGDQSINFILANRNFYKFENDCLIPNDNNSKYRLVRLVSIIKTASDLLSYEARRL